MADRNVWDFALVNVAAAMKVSGGTIEDARIACGAVECTPRRLEAVENAVRGQQLLHQFPIDLIVLHQQNVGALQARPDLAARRRIFTK